MTAAHWPVRIALVEVGSNSTKLLCVDVRANGVHCQTFFTTRVTRIGGGLEESGRIVHDGLETTLAAITDFKKILRQRPNMRLFAFATYALRTAGNAASVAARIGRQLGVPLRVLSGREEARFAYLGARSALTLRRANTLLVDIGGGSTELVLARRGRVAHAHSLPLGALLLTERFISTDPIEPQEFARLERHVTNITRRVLHSMAPAGIAPARLDLVASGGTITTTARVAAGGRNRRGPVPALSLGAVSTFLRRCLSMPLSERKRIPGLEPERADIIPAGMAIARAVMRHTRKRTLFPNPGGVREGVIAHLIENDFEW